MMYRPTTLVYSSHNRCEYLHREFIVQRALESPDNKTIFFLPMSMHHRHQQQYSYDTFAWYFRRFEPYGLRHMPFFWDENLRREDVDLLFTHLYHDQVVILGGGNSELGMARYRALGARFYGDEEKFSRVLHERQARGLLTVGFSAGADQLCHYLAASIEEPMANPYGFCLAHKVVVTLHHEPGREWVVAMGASRYPDCLVFGLPNDSGLAISQGFLPAGNRWQLIQFIVDESWDLPEDGWHIKTRQGVRIEHRYADGRHWIFNGGEQLLRIISPDGLWQDAWMKTHGRHILHYGTQTETFFRSFEHILENH